MIKLFILTFVLLLLCNLNTASAQDVAGSGDRTFEIGVTPFSDNPVSFNQFRLRTFPDDNTAYRTRGAITYQSDREDEDRRTSNFQLNLAPGIEWHFFSHDRISVYYGAELPISYRTTRRERDDETDRNYDGNGFFGLGLNAITGMDMHFLQRLYTGIEVGYGLNYRSYLDAEIGGEDVDIDRATFTLGTFAFPNFRFGIRF